MTAPTGAATTQAAQEAVALGLADALTGILTRIDLTRLSQQMPTLAAAIAGIIHRYQHASSTLATSHYVAVRREAGIAGRFTPIHAPLAPLRQVGATVRWASGPLWTADVLHAPDTAAAQGAIAAAERNIVAGAEKLVMDAARNTVIDNVHRDPKAHGWARVLEPGACHFCALLATRGAVYKTAKTADFRSHDHCRCQATPDFGQYEMPEQEQQALDVYRSLPHQSPKQMRASFRTAWDAHTAR